MPRPQSGATKDRLVRVQARSVTGPRHRPPRAGAGWPCSPSPDRQGRDRPEVAPRPRQIDPSEQMLRLASAPRIRPLRAGSSAILAPMARGPLLFWAKGHGSELGRPRLGLGRGSLLGLLPLRSPGGPLLLLSPPRLNLRPLWQWRRPTLARVRGRGRGHEDRLQLLPKDPLGLVGVLDEG